MALHIAVITPLHSDCVVMRGRGDRNEFSAIVASDV